jgi:hypothetical protein
MDALQTFSARVAQLVLIAVKLKPYAMLAADGRPVTENDDVMRASMYPETQHFADSDHPLPVVLFPWRRR